LRFASAETVEDLAQEVMVTLFRLSQRETLDDLIRGETAEPTTWYKA